MRLLERGKRIGAKHRHQLRGGELTADRGVVLLFAREVNLGGGVSGAFMMTA